MAVEARHLNLFNPQILSNRGMMMNDFDGLGNVYGMLIGYGVVPSSSGMVTGMESMIPAYGAALTESVMAKTAAVKSDSGLTYAVVPVSRKRTRDAIKTDK